MIDYHEALREMHKGRVVKYVGTAATLDNHGVEVYQHINISEAPDENCNQ